LAALREEDSSEDRIGFLKRLKDDFTGAEEENFFLEDELEDARTGKGYEEINMEQDGSVAQGGDEME